MEVRLQPSPQLGRRGSGARTAAIQLAAGAPAEKSPSFHFISSDGGHPVLSRKRSQPLCSRVGSEQRGRAAAPVSPRNPGRGLENSGFFLLQSAANPRCYRRRVMSGV